MPWNSFFFICFELIWPFATLGLLSVWMLIIITCYAHRGRREVLCVQGELHSQKRMSFLKTGAGHTACEKAYSRWSKITAWEFKGNLSATCCRVSEAYYKYHPLYWVLQRKELNPAVLCQSCHQTKIVQALHFLDGRYKMQENYPQ